MMEKNVQELTNEILQDQDLVSRLETAESSQEVSELLAEKGVQITAEQIDTFMAEELNGAEMEGELDEAALENVAGGFKLRYLNPFYWVGRLLAAAVTKDMC